MNRHERRRLKKRGVHPRQSGSDILFQHALAAHRSGRLQEALEHYEQLLHLAPRDFDTLALCGIAAFQAGDVERGIALLRSAVAINPNNFDAQYNLAHALESAGAYEEAVAAYRKALDTNPTSVDALVNLGKSLGLLKRYEEALGIFRRALDIQPDSAEALANLGIALEMLNQLEEAESCVRRALALAPHYEGAYSFLGNILTKQGRFEEAVVSHRQALDMKPDTALFHANLANTFVKQEKFDDACAAYRRALEIQPDFPFVQHNYTLMLLSAGRWREGWREYERRWTWEIGAKQKRPFAHPAWDGSALDGKSILVWGEQGVGDEIMFANMFPDLIERAGRVIVECDDRMVPLFERSFPQIVCYPRRKPPDPELSNAPIDYQVAMGSLGQYLRPDPDSFPRHDGYLRADAAQAAALREKYAALAAGRAVIGIAWSTSNEEAFLQKAAPLEKWLPVLRNERCLFVNLQYGDVKDVLDDFAERLDVHIHLDDSIDSMKDLDGFASQLAAMDLVVSISNVTVHMAAALNMPVWTLLHHAPDWRWLIRRPDSPWYPSMRLFRQPNWNDWDGAFRNVADALETFLDERQPA